MTAKRKFHERKRDWPQTVYKFWARPIDKLPDELWQRAREMNQLWNELLEFRRIAQTEAMGLEGDAKKQRWAAFNDTTKALIKNSPVNWECKGAILDRFNTAVRRAAKEHTELKFRGGIRKINIPHRYTGGGIELEKLFASETAKRLRLRPVVHEAYSDSRRETIRRRITRGVFGLSDNCQFEFETILHRPVPVGAIVKQANWCGVFNRNLPPDKRWSWSIQLVCEIPPERFFLEPQSPDTRGICAIDLGWRVMADGEYLRIGMMADDDGRLFEFRLPLFMAKKRDLSKQGYYTSFYDLLDLDSKIGTGVENAKTEVVKQLGGKPQGFDKMRQRGLRKMIDDPACGNELKTALEIWNEHDRKLNAIKASVMNRMKGRKVWLYRNLAAWLTRNYKTIILEGDLSLKKLGIEKGDYVIQNAAKYRQWAGLGELRTVIKNATIRNRCEVIGVNGAYSTIVCHVCGADSESNKAKRTMECPNGHAWDQDINAARNLLFSQIGGNLTQINSLRKMKDSDTVKPIEIPVNLRAVTVQCSLR